MLQSLAAALIAAWIAAPAIVRAEEAGGTAAHRHSGFYLHLDAGVGFMGALAPGTSLSAAASGRSIAIGGAVSEGLVLAGHAFSLGFASSALHGGTWPPSPDGKDRVELSGVGPNLTWYAMPANVYLSFTPAVTTATRTVNHVVTDPKTGVGARFAAGKEWWLAEHWGLGGALQLTWSRNAFDDAPWTTLAAAVALSATYN